MRKAKNPQHQNGLLFFSERQSLVVPETGIEPVRPLFTKRRILSAPRILRAGPEPAWILGYWLCIQRAKSVFCALLGRKSPAVLSPITAQHSCGAVGGYSNVFGGLARLTTLRSHSSPARSIFSHSAGGRRIER